MRINLCGTRGSTPAPGADFVRYGGHTSCLAVTPDGELAPSLLLDAGTGIRDVSGLLGARPFRGTIAVTHLHWDHVQGLPFFRAGDRDDAAVSLLLPAPEGGTDAEAALERSMSPPSFPITPWQLRGHWEFSGLEPGEVRLGPLTLLARQIPHKGGTTFGYRVSDGRAVLAYVTDHCPTRLGPGPDGLGAYHEAAVELARGADLLIHDAQLTAEEVPAEAAFGHAAAEYAAGLAARAGARRLALFHHKPSRTDDQLDAIGRRFAAGPVPVLVAAEGLSVEL